MGLVNISIRNCDYQIACNDGEEESLNNIAKALANRINRLSISHAKANDNLLLIIAALTIEDELNELRNTKSQLPLHAKADTVRDEQGVNIAVAEALDAISEYVENLARKLNS